MQLRHKKKLVKDRIDDQNSINDFLKPLLSGNLLKMFSAENPFKHFKGKSLPVNFPGGHQEYLEKWRYLFLYETYNILINTRRAAAMEDEFADQ